MEGDATYTGSTTGTELGDCLVETLFIIQYSATVGPCAGGHNCDRGTFNLMGNTTNIGTVYLSNSSESNDIFNYPPGETSGPNRYNEIVLTIEQAQEISDSSVGGVVDFSLECPSPALNACHSSVTWIQMIRDGQTIYEGCPVGNFISINPCTGEIF